MITTIEKQADFDQLMAGVMQQFRNLRLEPYIESSMRVLEGEHLQMFSEQREPPAGGKAWAKLSPHTRKKVGIEGPTRILVDTGRLKRSLTQPKSSHGIRQLFDEWPTKATIIFGTDVPYSQYHMSGTARMPARPHIGMGEDTLDTLTDRLADYVTKELAK